MVMDTLTIISFAVLVVYKFLLIISSKCSGGISGWEVSRNQKQFSM